MSLSHSALARTRLLAFLLAVALGVGLLVSLPQRADAATCPCSIFSASQTPTVVSDSDTAAVELGVKFRADQDGFVSGIRFYKGTANTGTHTGSLWKTDGTRLATVTFTGETASGWQQANFATPIAVTANTTYIASYYAPNGRYSADNNFFAGAIVNSPLTALADGTDGGNGVYRYGAGGGFPSSTYQSSNYWVDVVYNTSGTDTTKPTVTDRSPGVGATGVATSSVISATFSENVQESTISWAVTGAGGAAVAGAKSYNATNRTATFTPSAALSTSTTYTVALSAAKDTAGNTMDPLTWTFTTAPAAGSCPCSIWAPSAVPATPAAADNSAVELGVKFRSTQAGYITGIRFYKGTGNTGTHVGSLWKSDGTKLESVTFTGESATGWQQALFTGPVPVVAGTTYVASYYAPVGRYALNNNYFASAATTNGPLTALRNGTDGGNGVYKYGGSGYPNSTYQSSNYWVDVVFATTATDTTPPLVTAKVPADGASGVSVSAPVSATFSEPVTSSSITMTLKNSSNATVASTLSYNVSTQTATLTPNAALGYSSGYTVSVSGAQDSAGNTMSPVSWSFTTGAEPPPPPDQGPGGPIAVVTSAANPYSKYLAEILRTEGLNEFATIDVGTVSASTLASYDVVILGNVTISASQATALNTWVNGGGDLIAMRPGSNLSSLLGLTAASGGTTSNAYLKVDPTSAPGSGIVTDTIQFHGTADNYNLSSGTSAVATLYSSATAATTFPAVTLRSVGSNGGQAAAFTYDLPQSIALTRQGNPAWVGDERDSEPPIRSDDLFFGGSPASDWVNLAKVAIPQADEQQRLLANLVQTMNRDKKPLPRFWYFPRSLKAVVVGTGDDHANGGTAGRFDQLIANSPSGCSTADWTCLRYTSYIFPNSPLTNSAAVSYTSQGFEVGIHPTTNCNDWTAASLADVYATQLASWKNRYSGVSSPVTNRLHCMVWTDWATHPKTELANGMRTDNNYYYWPGSWIQDRPGFMSGSGMPMRFTDTDGTMIDVYQEVTQMTDESDQSYPATLDTLLGNATGPLGYYGAFTVNFHTDSPTEPASNALIDSALSHNVPVVSSKQMQTWLDGRNASSYSNIGWSANTLSFTVKVGTGATGLTGMVPMAGPNGTQLSGLTRGGSAVSYSTVTIKGLDYAQFSAAAGTYAATYAAPPGAMAITAAAADVTATPDLDGTTVSWTTPALATSEVAIGTAKTALSDKTVRRGAAKKHSLRLERLKPGTTYYYRLTSTDLKGRTVTWPAAGKDPASFTTPRADTTKPEITATTVSALPDGTARISWTTDEPTAAVVRLGAKAAKLKQVASVDELTKRHEVLITGLKPDSTYWIAGDATDASGNVRKSKVRSFTTPAAGVTDQQTASFRLGKTAGGATIDDSGLGTITLSGKKTLVRKGTFTSGILDAQAMVDWDRALVRADLPKRANVVLSVRTGSMSTPDASWTAWRTVPKSGEIKGGVIKGGSRYIQYKLTLTASTGAAAPSVSAVGFSNNAGPIEHDKETR